jgi:hypothetical protein
VSRENFSGEKGVIAVGCAKKKASEKPAKKSCKPKKKGKK